MQRILTMLFLAVASITTVAAQNVSPKTAAGDVALLFSINGFGDFDIGGSLAGQMPGEIFGSDTNLTTLSSTNTIVGFGMRYYVADRTAIRGAVGLSMKSASTPTSDSTEDDKASSMLLAISPGIEFHMLNAGPVSGYVGALVSYGMTSSSQSPRDIDSLEFTSSGSVFGVAGMMGVEFFPWSHVSLGAEYQLGAQFISRSSKFRNVDTDGPSATVIGISSLAVILGVYF